MTQPESPSLFTITKWTPPSDGSYSDLVQVGSALIILPILANQSLIWLDQSNNICLVRTLIPNEPLLRVGTSGILPMSLQSATDVKAGNTVTVSLTFGEDQEGPKGTFTAEADPPRPLPEGFWRRLLSLFRRLLSLFR